MSYPPCGSEPVSLNVASNWECLRPLWSRGADSFIRFLIIPLSPFISSHIHGTQMNTQTITRIKTTPQISVPRERKTSCLTTPSQSCHIHRSCPSYTQRLCRCRAEEGSDLEEQWRRPRGRAGGAPGARNVNWEDCFNKALIFADAGRGLAGGATQTGGQLTVRYCQQT